MRMPQARGSTTTRRIFVMAQHLPRLCSNDHRSRFGASGSYWFGTWGAAGAVLVVPLLAGGVEPAAGAVAGGVVAAPLPDGGVGVALPAGAGVVVPGNWLSTPLPASPDVAGTRSRMSIG